MAQAKKITDAYPRAYVYAGLMHLGLIGFLLFGMQWDNNPTPTANIVNAVAINEAQVQKEVDRLKKEDEKDKKKKDKEVADHKKELEKLEKQKEEEQKHVDELKKSKEQEEKKREEVIQQRKDEEKKAVQELVKQEKAKVLAEKKRVEEEKKLADVQKKQKEEAKKLEKKKAEQKQADAEAKAKKKKAEAEALAKKQAEDAQKDAEDAQKKAEADALAEQMASEQNAMNLSTVDKYKALIKARIESNWSKPPNSTGLFVKVEVRVIPGGGVGSVTILSSSGDAAFDMSVENAIRRAEPIPLPPNPDLLDYFRVIVFTFGE